ncbi:hypothetical protein AOR04_05145 [Pseudoalteromonas sp. 1_2015MBL_MicDiv]|nr:hypothetical protein AOR04_05145 [Pseudoalteromonas sp. 1_2015MBL_MicDiv]
MSKPTKALIFISSFLVWGALIGNDQLGVNFYYPQRLKKLAKNDHFNFNAFGDTYYSFKQ